MQVTIGTLLLRKNQGNHPMNPWPRRSQSSASFCSIQYHLCYISSFINMYLAQSYTEKQIIVPLKFLQSACQSLKHMVMAKVRLINLFCNELC